jgi:flagellar biosynthesis protein FlhF
MRILTFRGPSLNEAIAEVRAELGEDALILSWAKAGSGVELKVSTKRAGEAKQEKSAEDAEFDAWNAVAKRKSSAPRHDVFAGEGNAASLLASGATPMPGPKPALAVAKPKPATPGQRATQMPVRSAGQADTKPAGGNHAQVLVQTAPHANRALARLLVHAGADERQLEGLALADGAGGLRRALVDLLTDQIGFQPLDALPSSPIALAGAPGSGKTVTAAKLAARALAAGSAVTLISCDTGRSGGGEQLKALADRLEASFASADNGAGLRTLVDAAWAQGHVVLIDLPAAHPLQSRDLDLVTRLAESGRAEVLVCLAADGRSDDLEDAIAAWNTAGVRRAILTRMDLTGRRGGAIAAFFGTRTRGLSLAQISDTPFIAGGLALASASRLAAAILEGADPDAAAKP